MPADSPQQGNLEKQQQEVFFVFHLNSNELVSNYLFNRNRTGPRRTRGRERSGTSRTG